MTLAVVVKYRHRKNGLLGEARKCCKQTVTGILTKSSQGKQVSSVYKH